MECELLDTELEYHGLVVCPRAKGQSWGVLCDETDCYVGHNEEVLEKHGPYTFCPKHYKMLEPEVALGNSEASAEPVTTGITSEQYNDLMKRFTYHPPKGDQGRRYDEIRTKALAFACFAAQRTPRSAEQTRALNKIEEAVMLLNAAIARNE